MVRGGRERWLAVACVSVQAAVIAAVVAPSGAAVYRAEATLVVAAPPAAESALVEAGVVPRVSRALYVREVQGIAAGAVAGLVRAEAGGGVDLRVEARPREGVVRIAAEAETTSRAVAAANAVARAARAERAVRFRGQLDAAIARLERRLAAAPAHAFGTGERSPDEQRLIDLYTVAALPDPIVRDGAQTVRYRRAPGDRLLFAGFAGGGVLLAAGMVFAGAAARRPDTRERVAAGALALTGLTARFQLAWRLRVVAARTALARRIRDLSLARFF